jgi:hypothetical protein
VQLEVADQLRAEVQQLEVQGAEHAVRGVGRVEARVDAQWVALDDGRLCATMGA